MTKIAGNGFIPGIYILEELSERGMTVFDLQEPMKHTLGYISARIIGAVDIDEKFAKKLAKVFGTTPEIWLNLQKAYNDKQFNRT